MPLKITSRRLTWMHCGFQAGIGIFTLVSGVLICIPLNQQLLA